MDEHTTAEMISGYSASDWRLYVGTKNARYLPIFRRHEGQKRFFGMNWAAFLVPTGWSFYRQLYRRGLLLLLAAVLLFAATQLFPRGAALPGGYGVVGFFIILFVQSAAVTPPSACSRSHKRAAAACSASNPASLCRV